MQDYPKAVWSIPYISVTLSPSLKQNFIAYFSFKVSLHPDYIFEIHQQWQSCFSKVYSSSCFSCFFEPEIIKIGQSSYTRYSNNILNFEESTTILNSYTKKSGNLLKPPRNSIIYWYNTIYYRFQYSTLILFEYAELKLGFWKIIWLNEENYTNYINVNFYFHLSF